MQPVFTLGWIDVPSFTALMALALGAGLALAGVEARRKSLSQTDVLDVALFAVLVGILAARAGYVVEHWDYFRDHVDEIALVWLGGLAWHTGFVGGALGAIGFSVWRKLDTRAVFDALAPGLWAAVALGWIGCHLAGVAYGREVFPGDRWWFLAADLPDIYRLWNPRIATQLLGAAWATVCFVVAMASSRRSPSAARHSTFAVTLALYSAGMFLLGFTRGDAVPMLGTWRMDQVVDAVIVVVSMAYLLSAGGRRPTAISHHS